VVVSGAVAAAFAPRAAVERDARLVVPLAAEPELEQAVPLAAHSVARGVLLEQVAPSVVRSDVLRDALLVCPQDDSVAVHSAASLVDLLDALPEQVVPSVVRSDALPGDLPAYPLDDSVALHSVVTLVDPLDALQVQVASLVAHSVA
jgi:hypothetical protein